MKAVRTGILVLLVASGAAYGAFIFFGSSEKDAPRVMESMHGLSPDRKWEFSVERVDNGLGFGLGAVYDEIHVHRAGIRDFGHGDREKSSVFYVEASDRGQKPAARWLGERHLLIMYASGLKPGKMVQHVDDVLIEARTER
jgi:hypothetical protein